MLPDVYPGASGRGMVEFLVPAGGQISVMGLRAAAGGLLTSIPILAR